MEQRLQVIERLVGVDKPRIETKGDETYLALFDELYVITKWKTDDGVWNTVYGGGLVLGKEDEEIVIKEKKKNVYSVYRSGFPVLPCFTIKLKEETKPYWYLIPRSGNGSDYFDTKYIITETCKNKILEDLQKHNKKTSS